MALLPNNYNSQNLSLMQASLLSYRSTFSGTIFKGDLQQDKYFPTQRIFYVTYLTDTMNSAEPNNFPSSLYIFFLNWEV